MSLIEQTPTTRRIAALNDLFRTTFIGGKVMMTAGVAALPEEMRADIMEKVRSFDDFTEENDPYYEREFGSFEHADFKFFWKIDYYDLLLQHGSDDPSDPKQTTRVLTVMLASEY